MSDRGQETSSNAGRVTIRGIFHALVVALAWTLFIAWWDEVIPQITRRDATLAFWLIGLTVAVTAVLTTAWVRYNIGIFRRKGPRRTVPNVPERYDADTLGRRVEGPGFPAVRSAPVVVVSVRDGVKVFEVPVPKP